MRIRIIQKDINDTDYESYLAAVPPAIDLVCFGELSSSGCLYRTREVEPLESHLKRLRGCRPAVLLGLPCPTASGLSNVYMYHKDGQYQLYHKMHLFEPMNEHLVYRPGHRPGLFDTEFGRLGLAICYDLRFDDLFQALADGGAEKIFVPAAFPLARIEDFKKLLVRRAIDTGLPVVGINAVGDDGVNVFGGCSMIVTKDGRVLVQADEQEVTILEAEI